jgi:hypothetical protein
MLSRSLAPLSARFEEAGVLAAVSYRIKYSKAKPIWAEARIYYLSEKN